MFEVREIHSKEEAIEVGKDRGWCTGKTDNNYYETTYNPNMGKLFALYKKNKKRPDYQIFFSYRGGIEFRKKFNEFENHVTFFSKDGEGKELIEWFKKNLSDIQTSDKFKIEAQTFFRYETELRDCNIEVTATQSRLLEIQSIGRGNRLHNFIDTYCVQNLDMREFDHYNNNYNPNVFGLSVNLIASYNDLIYVHRFQELPPINEFEFGDIIFIQEEQLVLMKIEHPRFLISTCGLEVHMEMPSYYDSNGTYGVHERKVKLNFLLDHNTFYNMFRAFFNVKEYDQTRQNLMEMVCEKNINR